MLWFHSFFHGLHDIMGRWANSHVLQSKVGYLMELFSVGVGKLLASFWPCPINGTIIVRSQKRARQLLQDMVPFLIDPQVLLYKGRRPQPKVFRNTLNIDLGKKRPRGLAAVGTAKAVRFFKLGFMKLLHHTIQILWGPLFEPCKELFCLLMFFLFAFWGRCLNTSSIRGKINKHFALDPFPNK